MSARLERSALLGIKGVVASLPGAGPLYRALTGRELIPFSGSSDYWERRYAAGGHSGAGSHDRLAAFKAEILNAFVAEQGITSVIELGCGDGTQLALASYPAYVGIDVAPSAVARCRARFARDNSKRFVLAGEARPKPAELALSLDVLYHLVEDAVFERYMEELFDLSTRFVAIYSSNFEERSSAAHVRHRRFTDWVEREAPAWRLLRKVDNRYPYDPAAPESTSFADFHFFAREA